MNQGDILEDQDISFGSVKRRLVRVACALGNEREIRGLGRAVIREVVKLHGHQCAIAVLFYRNAEEAFPLIYEEGRPPRRSRGEAYTVAMLEWVPGGKWAEADKCDHRATAHAQKWEWRAEKGTKT